MKLNLGCGKDWMEQYPDYEGLDMLDFGQKYVTDIRLGIPGRNKWDEVMANHILEHLNQDELKNLFADLYRSIKENGIFKFVVPHMKKQKAWVLSHKTFWNEESVKFIETDGEYYGFGKWEIIQCVLNNRSDMHVALKKV